jgi:hypothetical protein
MDAILLGGNVWIKHLDALVSMSCESMIVQPAVYGRVVVVTCILTCSNHIIMKVLNWGYIYRVVVILKYIHQGCVYGKYLVYCLLVWLYWETVGLK